MKNSILSKAVCFLVLCFFLVLGIWIGISADISVAEKDEMHKEGISTAIAVVNQDMGAISLGTKENYSSAIIDMLDESFILVSPQAAQSGYDGGLYGAVVTFPSTLSQQVVAINSTHPEQVNLDFIINSQMSEKNYIDSYKKIIDLQYNINEMLSYMYVYSIYTEFHSAQNMTNELFQNDADDMTALSEVQLTDFTESLELGNVPNPGFYPELLNFSDFVEQVRGYANNISDEYLDSYAQAKADYKVFGEHLSELSDTIKIDADSWKLAMDQWKNDLLLYDTAVAEYASQLTQWGADANQWQASVSDWYDEIVVFKQDADALKATVEQFQADAAAFSLQTNQWKTVAQGWGNAILFSQSSRESAVVQGLEDYNANYEALNEYKQALADWKNALQSYSDSGASGSAPTLVLPEGFSYPATLNELDEWNTEIFEQCPSVSDDMVAAVSVSIDAPAEFSGTPEVSELPQAPEKPEVAVPTQPDTFRQAIFEMSTAVYDYNPEEYLTSEVRQSIYGYVDSYSEHVYEVKDKMDENLETNITKLDETYVMFNDYVCSLKDSALECHDNEQKNLDTALNNFYNAKTATSTENRLLVGGFSEMMPNSRIASVLNTDVVEFTVAPVSFVNVNIRTPQDKSAQEIFRDKIGTLTSIVFSAVCIAVLAALAGFLYKKSKNSKYVLED
ncbi:MAG: hypothetical protein WC900_03205 [Oscillospiraceae bacterium]|jgi:uncharacterized phage infection (PIP) family protein YhgE